MKKDEGDHGLRRFEVSDRFQLRLDSICNRLGLSEYLSAQELGFLCLAAYYAAMCNVAFNGLGGCNGEIKPEREPHRTGLERGFMAARDRLYGCAGWMSLPEFTRQSAGRILLSVLVTEQNLAID